MSNCNETIQKLGVKRDIATQISFSCSVISPPVKQTSKETLNCIKFRILCTPLKKRGGFSCSLMVSKLVRVNYTLEDRSLHSSGGHHWNTHQTQPPLLLYVTAQARRNFPANPGPEKNGELCLTVHLPVTKTWVFELLHLHSN
jgi:hypothetical protein